MRSLVHNMCTPLQWNAILSLGGKIIFFTTISCAYVCLPMLALLSPHIKQFVVWHKEEEAQLVFVIFLTHVS